MLKATIVRCRAYSAWNRGRRAGPGNDEKSHFTWLVLKRPSVAGFEAPNDIQEAWLNSSGLIEDRVGGRTNSAADPAYAIDGSTFATGTVGSPVQVLARRAPGGVWQVGIERWRWLNLQWRHGRCGCERCQRERDRLGSRHCLGLQPVVNHDSEGQEVPHRVGRERVAVSIRFGGMLI